MTKADIAREAAAAGARRGAQPQLLRPGARRRALRAVRRLPAARQGLCRGRAARPDPLRSERVLGSWRRFVVGYRRSRARARACAPAWCAAGRGLAALPSRPHCRRIVEVGHEIDVGGHVGGLAGGGVDRGGVVGRDDLAGDVASEPAALPPDWSPLQAESAARRRRAGSGCACHRLHISRKRKSKKEAAGRTGSLFDKHRRRPKRSRRTNYMLVVVLFAALVSTAFVSFTVSVVHGHVGVHVGRRSAVVLSMTRLSTVRLSTAMLLSAPSLLLQAASAKAAPATRIRARIQNSLDYLIWSGVPRLPNRAQHNLNALASIKRLDVVRPSR